MYSRRILFGLAAKHPETDFYFHYRSHRILRSLRESLPANAHRRLLRGAPSADIFHALNQRVDTRARRTVTTFHDLFVMTGEYSTPEFRERFTAQAREAAERSDLIIAISAFTAGQVESLLKVERTRIRVVPHGTDPASETNEPRKNIVLCTGAIQKRKNIACLVRAFDRSRTRQQAEWTLVLAGAADGYGAAEELAGIEISPNRVHIRVAGYATNEELRRLYAQARIFAFPSLDEGFGMPVLDAMSHGVPVITSNCSAMPEVAGDAALLVDPHDESSIADGLARLMNDAALRDELIRKGRARAAEFSWDRAVRSTWAVYEDLL